METRPQLYRPVDGQKEEKRRQGLLSQLLRLPTVALLPLVSLFKFARGQKISYMLALDEAVFALPKQFPDAVESVSDWVLICKEAGIPAVGCTKGPTIRVEELEIFGSNHQATPATDAMAVWINQQYQQGNMWRWECCASEQLKMLAGLCREDITRQQLPKVLFQVDERLFHILWDQQATEIGIVARPWVLPEMFDGFPVEFRVFHTRAGDAACNYYPQRALSPEFIPKMEEAVNLTKKLANFQVSKESGLPQVPAEFSCDWLLSAQGDLLFLEAGPPHTPRGGAHPCCFAIEGLDPARGPIPGRRLLASEPGAQFYIDPRRQEVIDSYKQGSIDFEAMAKKMKIPPSAAAMILAVQGIIPREMAEKLVHTKSK
jgi:hypothetical protein